MTAPSRPFALAAALDGGRAMLRAHGPGLPPDRIEDAFKPFVRLQPSRSAETGGMGLGLASPAASSSPVAAR
jgi:signal transduction histidine kinase